jgi:hypothetical protein
MNPTSQQQPVLPLDQLPSRTPLAKEFRSLQFRNGFVRMLHDVKLVVHQATLRNPLLQAQTIRFMHIHTGRLHSPSLKSTQLRLEELVQAGLLPLPPEPQRFPGVQIAHHGEKLLLLAQIDLVHPICRNTGLLRPAPQRFRYRRSMARTVLLESANCRATRRTAALSQASPTASSKRLLNGALLGSCGTFSVFTPQSGQRTRYNSTTTVVRNSKPGRSRTSRS